MIYCKNDKYELRLGKMQEELQEYPDNYFDSIVTDPPYEIGFMGKDWDNSGVAFQKETWEKCFRVLKPGGYLLSFGGCRTSHRIACAIEDAGFEIRDTIMWLFGSGFPKSMNIGKAIEGKLTIGSANVKDIKLLDGEKTPVNTGYNISGKEFGYRDKEYDQVKVDVSYKTELGKRWSSWGTCLKPAYEPVIVARKPFKGSLVDNVLEYGVGGLNIDGCRIQTSGNEPDSRFGTDTKMNSHNTRSIYGKYSGECGAVYDRRGRFPSNLILTYDESDYEEVCGGFPVGGGNGSVEKVYEDTSELYGDYKNKLPFESYGDSGSASRYFYSPKASKQDREEGLDKFDKKFQANAYFRPNHMEKALLGDSGKPYGRYTQRHNNHPTVKPVSLMKYLIRLVTPKCGKILDPFMGSGSTGKAAMIESREKDSNYTFVGIEMTEEYLPICKARIDFGLGCELEDEIPVKEEELVEKKKEESKKFDFLSEIG